MEMKKTLALGLVAVSMVFMISCGSDPLKTITGSKKETKAQFYNESWYASGEPWTARLNINGVDLTAYTGSWSQDAVIPNCDKETSHMVTLFDAIWPVYVFTNVPLECEKHNLYRIRVLGQHHYIEWSTGDYQKP